MFLATVLEMPAICCKIAGDAVLSSTPTWFTTVSTTDLRYESIVFGLRHVGIDLRQ